MPILVYCVAAGTLGILVSWQPLMNAVLARATGSAIAASSVSILIAFLGALALLAVWGRGDLSRATMLSVPWWVYLAGLIGTAFVAGGVVIAPVTGALLFVLCVVAGQLFGATLADHFGAFGIQVRPVSWERVAGLVLVLAGVVLVQRG